jgi:hypothetical protein
MSAMTETGYGAYMSKDELATKLRAHHENLLSETGAMGKNSTRTKLETTLKIYMNPFVEEADTATEYVPFHGAALAYLAMCRQHVVPMLPAERREQMQEETVKLEMLIRAYEQAEHRSTQTLVHSVYELASCVERSQAALTGKLEEIRCELSSMSTALQPVSLVAQGSEMFGHKLAHMDYILTGSMALLVGPLPEPPPPPAPAPPAPPAPLENTVIATPETDEADTPMQERELEAVSHAH